MRLSTRFYLARRRLGQRHRDSYYYFSPLGININGLLGGLLDKGLQPNTAGGRCDAIANRIFQELRMSQR
jgi:hypothetical protein